MKRTLVLVLALLALVVRATNYVDRVNGDNSTAVPGSQEHKYATIQAAIDGCPQGGVVSLKDDLYDITSAVILTNKITLVGSHYTNCVIRQTSNGPDNVGRVVSMGDNTTLRGLTVTGGRQASGDCNQGRGKGTGILAGSNCTISYCCVSNNYGTGYNGPGGGGIYITSGTIDHSLILKNWRYVSYLNGDAPGAGIRAIGEVTVDTCLVAGNHSNGTVGRVAGGGIYAEGKLTLRNSTIVGNSANATCGGVYFANSASTVVNCIFSSNLLNSAVSDYAMSDAVRAQVTLVSSGNVFTEETTTFGTTARAADAQFVDAAAKDYHLTKTSPAVDFATWYSDMPRDLDGIVRGHKPDSGCYEYPVMGVIVLGDPTECGTPTPGYGDCDDLTDGESYVFRCPSESTNGCVASSCLGWRLTDRTGAESSGDTTTVTVPFKRAKAPYVLTWRWSENKFVSRNEIYVSPAGSGTQDGYTAANALGSIDEAIQMALVENPYGAGGTVHFAAGTYALSAALPLYPDLVLAGAADGETVLNGSGSSKLAFSSSRDMAGVVLQNLVMTNFSAGCVYATTNSGTMIVTDCRFASSKYGMRMSSAAESKLLVSNCVFTALNTTDVGDPAGLKVSTRLRPTVVGCLFSKNTGNTYAGGDTATCFAYVPSAAGAHAVLRDCRFLDNASLNAFNGAVLLNSSVWSGLRIHGCTFLRNRCTMYPDAETNQGRSPCITTRYSSGNVYVYDSYFGYNTLTNTATAQNPWTASVLAYRDNGGSALFANCTFEYNCICSEKSSARIATIMMPGGANLGVANCVFNGNDVFYRNASTQALSRQGELNVGEGSSVFRLIGSIFTHDAADYAYCHSASEVRRPYGQVIDCYIKGYAPPSSGSWKLYVENLSTEATGEPGLTPKPRSNHAGRLAHGVARFTEFSQGGEYLWMGSDGIPSIYHKNCYGSLSGTNHWLPLLSDTGVSDAEAAALGLSTANDPMPDAFGDVRNPKRLAYGPVNPPPGGFAIIVR